MILEGCKPFGVDADEAEDPLAGGVSRLELELRHVLLPLRRRQPGEQLARVLRGGDRLVVVLAGLGDAGVGGVARHILLQR